MATKYTIERLGGVMVRGAVAGRVSIPQPDEGPLTRLNYFDGKFLHAEDLDREQRYHRAHVELSNRAGGAGIVHGLDASRVGDSVRVEPGLAIDREGRVLLLTEQVAVGIGDLIEQSRRRFQISQLQGDRRARFEECESVVADEPVAAPVEGVQLYLITVSHAEGLCGHEDVYGRLCEDACATESDRPYAVEGVVLRAEPLHLTTPLATSAAVALGPQHLRSLVASAFFADEPHLVSSLISAAGLRSGTWCRGAELANPPQVAVAMVARSGSTTLFLDPWAARRERIDPPPRRYWAWRMSMRPWEVFLAQVLQFQCQLHELIGGPGPGDAVSDPCAPHGPLLRDVDDALAGFPEKRRRAEAVPRLEEAALERIDLPRLRQRVRRTLESLGEGEGRRLLSGGIAELPPAGYLPVEPRSVTTLEEQVGAMVGDSLFLRFCAVRRDHVPHALEEAQHMRRISLLEGIDDPRRKPPVDVLVPDGEVIRPDARPAGLPFRGRVALMPFVLDALIGGRTRITARAHHALTLLAAAAEADASMTVFGAGHGAVTSEGASFCFAGTGTAARDVDPSKLVRAFDRAGRREGVIEDLRKVAAEVAESGSAPLRDIEAAERTAMLAHSFVAAEDAAPGRFDVGREVGALVPALWFDGRCAADVFDLGVGERTPVTAELTLALPFGGEAVPGAFELTLEAELEVTAPGDQVGAPVVGWLEGTLERHLHGGQGEDEAPQSFGTKVRVFAERADDGSRTVRVEVASSSLPMLVEAGWGDRPLAVTVGVHFDDPAEPVTAAVVRQQEDPSVLDAADAHHRQAVAGLPIVAAALARPKFEEAAHARLFPPPSAAPVERIVGPLDWVLFRRRRAIDCAEVVRPTVTPPAKAPPVPYQVWYARWPTQRDAAEAWKEMREGKVPPVEPLGSVRYPGGEPTLVSGARSIESIARKLPKGNKLVRLGIASTRPGEGDQLLDARLKAFEVAIEPLVERTANYDSNRLDALDDILRKASIDAMIVMFTVGRPLRRTLCHEVYATDRRGAFYYVVRSASVDSLGDGAFVALGQLEFDSGGTEARGSLRSLTEGRGFEPPLEAAVVVHDGPQPIEPLEGQARAAVQKAEAVFPGTALVHVVESTHGWPLGCPLATVLLLEEGA